MKPDDTFNLIKRLTIIGIVSDDELMEVLVLKGGNALGLIYGLTSRPSIDIDFSIENDFSKDKLGEIGERIERNLRTTFAEHNLDVFDFGFSSIPPTVSGDFAGFWGGYRIEFKVVLSETHRLLRHDKAALRRQAEVIGPRQLRTIKVDMSKFEVCEGKVPHLLDGYQVYVYTPDMLVAEKLRAICQQFPDYRKSVKSPEERPGRARDFYDIHTLCSVKKVDLLSPQACELTQRMFAAKHVSWDYLQRLEEMRDFHAKDWRSVQDSVTSGVMLEDFSFYFDFVRDLATRLHSLRVVQSPSL